MGLGSPRAMQEESGCGRVPCAGRKGDGIFQAEEITRVKASGYSIEYGVLGRIKEDRYG